MEELKHNETIFPRKMDGRETARKTISGDKIVGLPDSSVDSSSLASNAVTKAKVADDAIGKNELDYEEVAVTVAAGASSGTGTATSGSVIIGFRVNGNQDQFIDSMSISGTTVTVTLAANATADNIFVVILIKA